jgi:hypothetical protein
VARDGPGVDGKDHVHDPKATANSPTSRPDGPAHRQGDDRVGDRADDDRQRQRQDRPLPDELLRVLPYTRLWDAQANPWHVNYPALLPRGTAARSVRAGLSPARASRVAVPPPCMDAAWTLPVAVRGDRRIRLSLILGGLPHVTPEVSRGFSRPDVHHVTVRGFGRSLLSPGGSGARHASPSSGPVYGGPSERPVGPPELHQCWRGRSKNLPEGGLYGPPTRSSPPFRSDASPTSTTGAPRYD